MSKKYKEPIGFYYERYSPSAQCTQLELGGHAEKEFVRFFDQDYLKVFYRAIRKKGSNYRCIYNDVILSGYDPKYVSVMKKTIDGRTGYNNENAQYDVAGCRLANMFGMPTVYNFIFTERSVGDYDIEYRNNTHLLSVDFAETGKEMVDIHEAITSAPEASWNSFDIKMDRNETFSDLNLESWFKIFDNLPKMNTKIPSKILTPENIEKIKKDFIKMYFFRKYIIDDEDLEPRNVSLVFDRQKGTLGFAPSHDYDFCFRGYSHYAYKIFSEQDLSFCIERYPNELRQVMKGFEKFHKKYDQFLTEKEELVGGSFCDIYTSLYKELQDKESAKHITETVVRNLRRLTSMYSVVCADHQKPTSTPVM